MVHVHGLLVDTPQVIAQMRQLGLTQRVSTYSAGVQPEAARPAWSGGGRLHRHVAGAGLDDNKNLPAFLERWKAEQKRPPNGLPYLQYQYDIGSDRCQGCTNMSSTRSQPPTGDTLREALLTIREFDLPMTGKTVVDGHHVKKPVYLLTVEKGEFVPMATLT